MQRQVLGIEIQPQHAQCRRRPRQKSKAYPQDCCAPCHRISRGTHRANAPRAHAQRLSAAQPIERIVAGDDQQQSRPINIDPGSGGGGYDRCTVSEEKRAAGEYHQQGREEKCVVHQCRDSTSKPGTGADDHGGGAVAGFFALEGGDFAPGEAGFALGEADFALGEMDFAFGDAGFALGGGSLGTSSCSNGLNMAS